MARAAGILKPESKEGDIYEFLNQSVKQPQSGHCGQEQYWHFIKKGNMTVIWGVGSTKGEANLGRFPGRCRQSQTASYEYLKLREKEALSSAWSQNLK